ncbi:relaxase/mobilization nuclease domain-containing protein [Vibrio parahaemolyticus]|uniref:relaxase/mobilization nuclease domain-containing protein n=1 Tax=Vibrio parahaemolyticus TaxID=670 RepID=UPI001299D608|nr:relaxase/mobilization nuclease domain-containing protein [Vibrio parahaemolyticus]EJB8586718.1 relaxase/mobilization nuclease domain-containing protein [Vibrio parahaemolyticus]MDF4951421.1 relaxase/mobilization nuclease domain-containing protein [Vibrio parahaemolyticus]MDF5123978.1 relaxase/mobilization nuclease domain-containing protein [Vibrio parahaemolyticus]MDF5527508.1 relaxase/mobilization nuclease domain-containing protein [Vibrio parahaemolyticus]MDF5538240.1 relaxase/mobilizatio
MIVKFFKGDHSAVTNGLKYLEGGTKRRKVKPVLLSGNPDITREWLKQASRFSKAFTYGCLSFEEADIPAHQKQQLMASFEQTLMTGLKPEQYDIVWIEHRDKGRLELNFHIVNMELTTGKALTPYVHRRDMVRIDEWKSIANDTFGFTDPNDPAKARTFTWGDNPRPRRELMAQIDDYLFDLAVGGTLNNQQDVIDALNDIEGITVTRNTKSSISFTADGYQKPIRLKGELYGKSYKGIENSAAKQAERTASFTRQRHERIKENKQQLQQRNRHLARQRRKIYQPPYGKATSSELAISHDIEPDSATGRDSARAIPDTRIRNQSVSALPSNSKVARQPDSVVLPDHKAIEEKNKKTINQYANDHTDQSKGPSTWVSEVLTKLRAAIKSFAGCINRREAEARELGNIYQATQLNCDRLERMLKERGVTRSTLEPLHRFKRDGNQVTISALQPRSD